MLRINSESVRGGKEAENPYTRTWVPQLIQKKKRIDLEKRPAFDADGNRLKGVLFVPQEQDGERFVKVVREWLPEQVAISNTAKKVLLFVQYQCLAGNAIVYLPAQVGAEFCRFKQTQSFHTGVAELILYEYLARTEKPAFYFINPQKFFNGDRRTIKGTFSKPTQAFQTLTPQSED